MTPGLSLLAKLARIIQHTEDFRETGRPFYRQSADMLLKDPEVVACLAEDRHG